MDPYGKDFPSVDDDQEDRQRGDEEEEEEDAVEEEDKPIRIKGLYKVLDYLYISDAAAASKREALLEQHITTVVNCVNEDVDDFFPEDFEYHSFHVEDARHADISQHFAQVYDIIKEFRDTEDAHKRVLVHDEHGTSQAATLIIAYMLQSAKEKRKKLPLKAALKFVQGKSRHVEPNSNFLKQLIALEEELFGETSMRVGSSRKGGGGGGGRRGGGSKGRGGGGKSRRGTKRVG